MIVAAPRLPPGVFPVLSLRQPWAWAIMHAGKTIENRTWETSYRGHFWLHASKTMSREEYRAGVEQIEERCSLPVPSFWAMVRGAIVGRVTLTGIKHIDEVRVAGDEAERRPLLNLYHPDPGAWATGPWCFMLENPLPLDPILPCSGRQLWFPPPPELSL